MSEAVGAMLFMAWLGCGGWALAMFIDETEEPPPIGALIAFCLLLAPFALGAALAFSRLDKARSMLTPTPSTVKEPR